MEKVVAIIQQGPCRQARFLDNIGKSEGHAGAGNFDVMGGKGCRTLRKMAISGPKSSFTLRKRLQATTLNVRSPRDTYGLALRCNIRLSHRDRCQPDADA